MTQRIDPFFFEYDAKNWTFFFFNITQRIEPLFEYDSKNWISFWVWLKKSNFFFFEYDSMNRTHFLECESNWNFWLKNSQKKKNKIDFFTWPEESNPLFFNMTQRIEPFSIGLKDSMLFSLTQRIELCLNRTDRIGPFFLNMTQRIEIFSWFFYMSTFFKNDAENWTLFLWIWRKELNPFFFECDVKNLIFFLNMTQRIEPFSYLTQRNELLFLDMNDSMNWTFEIWLKELNIWTMCQKKDSENGSKNWTFCFSQNVSKNWFFLKKKNAQRIEPLFHFNYFVTWLNELNFFLNLTRRVEFFPIWLERVGLFFFEYDSKTWTFVWVWLKEVSLFFWTWLKESTLFLKMTQRIEPFFLNVSQRMEPFFKCDSKNWTSFWIWFRELNLCQIYTTQSQRIELSFFFSIRLNELNIFLHVIHVFKWFKDFFLGKISQRIDFSYDSKNGTWRKDLKFMFLKLDSKNWTLFFFDDSQTWKLFFFQKLWRKELNL